MSFDWSNYLDLAKKLQSFSLLKSGIQEACQRTSISRVYYAAYHTALAFAEKEGYPKIIGVNATKNHGKLKKWYKGNADMDRKRIGILLSRMGLSRNDCDYEDTISTNIKSMMDNTIIDGEEIFTIISRITP